VIVSPRRLAPLLALALASCSDEPPACPGDAQGTFRFTGVVPQASDTPPIVLPHTDCKLVPENAATSFPATVSFTGDTTGALCLDRLLTEPRACQRTGDTLFGCAAGARDLTLGDCPCPIRLRETLSGTLSRTGTRATGFSGELLVELSRSTSVAASACFAEQDALAKTADCPPPETGCSATYDVAGTP